MFPSSYLGRFIIWLRRQPWVASVKAAIPKTVRQYAWDLAAQEEVVTVAGNKMYIPAHARNAFMITDEYEPEVRAKLKELLKPGMTFCDVGANLGVITLFAARLVGPEGRVFSFEPFPENAAVLRKNIELNRFANVTVVEQAVSDNNGEAVFQVSECCGCHTLGEKAAASAGEAIVVKTTRLDSIPGLTRMDVLKSDTEGMELGVLRGLGSLKPSAILIEANTFLFNVMGRPTPEHTGPGFLRAIRDLGYEIVENVEDPKAGTEKIESNYDGHCNLYIRPAGAGA